MGNRKKPVAAKGVVPNGAPGRRAAAEPGIVPNNGSDRVPRALRGVVEVTENAIAEARPLWGLSLMDEEHNCSWTWRVTPGEATTLLGFLKEMERLRWREIRAQMFNSKRGSHKKHHWMPADDVCTEAKRRLDEIGLGDQEEIFRFRLSNKARLWGIILDRTFYPIWWDSDHKVYPTSV